MKTQNKTKQKICLGLMLIFLILLLACELFKEKLFGGGGEDRSLYLTVSRLLGGLFSLSMMVFCSLHKLLKPRLCVGVLVTLPCWLIAVNNFPFITFFSGRAEITSDLSAVMLFALECLCVGFFEEIVFRGCVLTLVMKNRRKNTLDLFVSILISSAIFGVFHLVNIFAGASPVAVILQVGYSTLIGAMCAVVMMKTGCIWHCVLLHSVYNFCGGVVPRCGSGVIWDTPTILLTAVVSVIVAVYVLAVFLRIRPDELDKVY